jgi:hypothetical protein
VLGRSPSGTQHAETAIKNEFLLANGGMQMEVLLTACSVFEATSQEHVTGQLRFLTAPTSDDAAAGDVAASCGCRCGMNFQESLLDIIAAYHVFDMMLLTSTNV